MQANLFPSALEKYIGSTKGTEAAAFDRQNPEVYELFYKFCLQVRRRGYQKFSAKAIFERIRWEKMVETYDPQSEFKLNNNHTAYYSRKVMHHDPSFEGFFEVRSQQ